MLIKNLNLNYYINQLFKLVLGIILITFTACGGSDDNEVETDDPIVVIDPITISSYTPVVDEENISVNSEITVTFSESIEVSGIEVNFSLSNSAGDVAGTNTISNTELTFTPSEELDFSTEYTVTVGSASTSEREITAISWVFTTENAVVNPITNALFSDDFESGTFGEEINGFSWGGKTNVSVVDDPNEDNNKVVQFLFKGSSDLTEDAFSELRFNLGGLYKEIWMKYRLYVPINYFHRRTPSSDNSKGYFMFWSGEYNNRSNTLIASSWWPSGDGNTVMNGQWKTNTETSQHYREESLSAMAIDRTTDLGKWQDVVVRVKVADHLTSNGAIQVWKNNELIYSNLEVDNYSEDNIKNGIEKGYLLGWSNAGFDTETKMMIDDFVIGESAEGIGFETN